MSAKKLRVNGGNVHPAPLAHSSRSRVGFLAVGGFVLFLLATPAADARVVRGTSRGDVLRGTNRADVIKGRAGNDRLYGRAGNDRLSGGRGRDLLVGGPGKDTLSCGSGRDTAVADSSDRVIGCEKVKLPTPSPVSPQGTPTSPPAVKPAPPPASLPPPPPHPATDLTSAVVGRWGQQVFASVYLWFFNDDPVAGYRTGSRSFCPNGNCALSPGPAPFAWFVQGDVLAIEFYTGTYEEYEILGYDSGTGILTLNSTAGVTELERL